MDILGYLESCCWRIVNTDQGLVCTLNVIQLCFAYIIHKLSHNLTKTSKIDKKLKLIPDVFAAEELRCER